MSWQEHGNTDRPRQNYGRWIRTLESAHNRRRPVGTLSHQHSRVPRVLQILLHTNMATIKTFDLSGLFNATVWETHYNAHVTAKLGRSPSQLCDLLIVQSTLETSIY